MIDIVVVFLIFVVTQIIVLYSAVCVLLHVLRSEGLLNNEDKGIIKGVCEVIDS